MHRRRIYEEAYRDLGQPVPGSLLEEFHEMEIYYENNYHEHLHGLLAKVMLWTKTYGEKPPLIYRDDHLGAG